MRRIALPRGPFAAARIRLVLMNLLVVSAMLAVMAVAVYAWEAQITDHQITQDIMDRAGHETAQKLLASAGAGDSSGVHENGDSAEEYEPSSPNVFTVLLDARGHVVYDPDGVRALGLPDMASARSVLSGRASSALVTIGDDEHAFRLYTIPIREDGKVIGALQTGMSLASRSRQLHGLLATLLLVGFGMLALTAVVSLFLADRALAPTREAYERERRFVLAASHELRTPLAIVRSQGELVARHLRRPPEADDGIPPEARKELANDVDEITNEVDYMTRLVRDLLVLARPDEARKDVAPQPVNLSTLVEAAIASVRPQAEARGLSLTIADHADPSEASGEPVLALGDIDRVRQLLLILLENALAYTPPGGSVSVSVGEQPGHRRRVFMRVEDTGKGIAAEHIPHIFEPFYRADPARARGERGDHTSAGLGLALAQNIARGYGGEITVRSRLGAGSAFTVTLPRASAGGEARH